MNTDSATTDPTTRTYSTRDSYGRNVRHYEVNGRTVAVIVTVPRATAQPGQTHIVNDWAGPLRGIVAQGEAHSFHGSLADARAAALAVVTREMGAALQHAQADDVWQEGPQGN